MTTDTPRGAGSKAAGSRGKGTSRYPNGPVGVEAPGGKGATDLPPEKSGSFARFGIVKHPKAKVRDLSAQLRDFRVSYSREREELEQRVRKVEQRMFVTDHFDRTHPVVLHSTTPGYLRAYIPGVRSVVQEQTLYADVDPGIPGPGGVHGSPELSGPLDPSKVTMKPTPRSVEARRRTTLLLLGINRHKPTSK
ncbi:hypothetical protein BDI4_1240009 [Burkholderia diffusa]|uniref:hypothetical protein n=1 Tax=Burkholderia diffusa TaxID=488732 RepID=UPI001CAD6D51|nr:hypothetical protein [Burkholderia diffusa]CAG9243160.1 hypothetical protein BDI4_1240009 [Burkholderia diffusa]